MSEENDMYENKRFKTADNRNATGKSDYNFMVQSDRKDSFVQNEIEDNSAKLEDRLDVVYPFKKEQASFDARHRAISQHKDVKQDQYYTNERRRKRRSNSRDRDGDRRKSIDRYSWTTSVSEKSNSGYKESNYRYNSRSRSYSRGRSNQESLSNNHLRMRSNSSYRNRKYDDCKNDSRYRNERSKRDYNSKEDKAKCRSRERSNLRDTSRYLSSDVEDRESGNYKNKYEKNRTKQAEANTSDNKRSHNNTAGEIDFQPSSIHRTVVNTVVNYSVRKDTVKHETKNKSDIKLTIESTSIGSTSTCSTIKNLSNLEEGEVLDSPEKTNNLKNLSNDNKIKTLPIENKNEDKNEQLNSRNNDVIVNEVHNCNNEYKSHLRKNSANSTVHNTETNEQIHDSDFDSNCYINEKLKSSTKAADNLKETNNIDSVNDTKTEMNDLNIKTKKEEVNKPSNENAIKVSEDNNFVTDSIACKINEELNSNKITTKVEAVLDCDIEGRDESQILTEGNSSFEKLDKCNTEANHSCLNDHNYNQNPLTSTSDVDAVKKPMILDCFRNKTAAEMQLEKPVDQSIDVKKTMSSSLMKSKKDQQNKGIVISRRRKAVTLSDSKASMTVVMNENVMKTFPVTDNCNDNDSVLKPRACKTSRTSIKTACK